MKIIFLDMDGVLNNRNSMALYGVFKIGPEAKGIYTVDRTCVLMLNCLVRYTGAKIVISSTWRHITKDESVEVKSAFEYAGLPELWDSVIDVTPIHPDRHRGREIDAWLDRHPGVTEYVIFDDDSFDITQEDHFVHVKGQYGLQIEHIETAFKMFGIDMMEIRKTIRRR